FDLRLLFLDSVTVATVRAVLRRHGFDRRRERVQCAQMSASPGRSAPSNLLRETRRRRKGRAESKGAELKYTPSPVQFWCGCCDHKEEEGLRKMGLGGAERRSEITYSTNPLDKSNGSSFRQRTKGFCMIPVRRPAFSNFRPHQKSAMRYKRMRGREAAVKLYTYTVIRSHSDEIESRGERGSSLCAQACRIPAPGGGRMRKTRGGAVHADDPGHSEKQDEGHHFASVVTILGELKNADNIWLGPGMFHRKQEPLDVVQAGV
ncbi:hypothetical protein DFH09DRAFT_1504698, partial [Mycena vulgaris]